MMVRLSQFMAGALCLVSATAFAPVAQHSRVSTELYDGDGTGGWGIGGSREMVPEEFVRGDRRYFDGYQMSEQGDFRRKIEEDKEALKKSQMEELLGVAKMAGINMKDAKGRLNKFEDEMLDDDDLDLTV